MRILLDLHFWIQDFFLNKIFWNINFVGPQKISGHNILWDPVFSDLNFLGTKICFYPNFFILKHFLDQQFHLDQIIFWEQTFFRTKFSPTQYSLWPKKSVDWDISEMLFGKLECGSAQLNLLFSFFTINCLLFVMVLKERSIMVMVVLCCDKLCMLPLSWICQV